VHDFGPLRTCSSNFLILAFAALLDTVEDSRNAIHYHFLFQLSRCPA
jgi:hypothetical protein